MTVSRKDKTVAREAKTAKLRDVAEMEPVVVDETEPPVAVVEDEKAEPEKAEPAVQVAESRDILGAKAIEGGGFLNTPKLLHSKGDRTYAGAATQLMNELYDAAGVPEIHTLPGWERIALIMARACEKLEKAGWRKGRK